METPLLQTKLYVPPARSELVSRPRLIERLSAGLRRKLTLVSAPAGFGKTTLVSDWIARIQSPQSAIRDRVAWLSLNESDNESTRFLTYLIAALQTIEARQEPAGNIGSDALSALQSPQPPPAEVILTILINEIAAIPDRIVLVLDDYHLIEATSIHEALTFLLEHLPPQMHLVIATRDDPHLPLARLRARGQLAELRAAELRFTSSETAEFLNRAMGLNLSTEDITALDTRTEGWIAGLQLAAISLQGRDDTSRLIQSFTGSHRFVLDYLIEEVLEQQSESVQTFLLRTAVLGRLAGPLCDALTGQDNGQATLEILDHANLFVVPLEEERRWYRYHHLFAELLQQRLNAAHPNLIDDLHAKAMIWYEANGHFSEAIHHALAREDAKSATRLIEKGALEALERSDLRFILNWVDRLPDNEPIEHPWLFVYHSWALLLTGQVGAVGPRLENTEWLLDSISDEDETKKQEMTGYIAGLKAILALWQRDFGKGLDYANQAIANLSANNWIRGYCAIVMGSAFWGNGNLIASKDAFAESSSVGKSSGNKMLEVSGACNLAHSLELEGHLQLAVNLFQDSFQLAEQDGRVLPVAGYIHIELARVLYELNELDLAGDHLVEGIKLCQRLADGRAEGIGHCLLARVHLAEGDFDSVVNSIQNAEQADPSPDTSFDLRGGEYPQIRLWLKEKKLKEVDTWLEESGVNVDSVSFFKTKLTYTMHARALVALGREHPDGTFLNDALDLLEDLLEMAGNNGWGSKVIEILALQALALQEEGDTAQAMVTLERALALAEPEGFIRTFVDEGPPMARLLYEAASCGIALEHTRRLLAAFPVAEPERTAPSKPQAPRPELVEPLSERELEVLHLVAEGLTNREVAARLYLSLNTVKSHTRSIYGKLGAHNRTQAVARARALGVLPST